MQGIYSICIPKCLWETSRVIMFYVLLTIEREISRVVKGCCVAVAGLWLLGCGGGAGHTHTDPLKKRDTCLSVLYVVFCHKIVNMWGL